jgi:hypothetical protein
MEMWKLEAKKLDIERKRRKKLIQHEMFRKSYYITKKIEIQESTSIHHLESSQSDYIEDNKIDFSPENEVGINDTTTGNEHFESNNSEYMEENNVAFYLENELFNTEIDSTNNGSKKEIMLWKEDKYMIAYTGDDFNSNNIFYNNFNIRNEIKNLLCTVTNYSKPHDYYELVSDNLNSKLTIGEYMILHRETMIRHHLTEKAGDEILALAKLTLPKGCILHNKRSFEALSYMSPPLMLKYDICSKKGCNVFVGNNEKLNICNGKKCNARRWKSCTKKKCIQDGIVDSCMHLRPALKQVNYIITLL